MKLADAMRIDEKARKQMEKNTEFFFFQINSFPFWYQRMNYKEKWKQSSDCNISLNSKVLRQSSQAISTVTFTIKKYNQTLQMLDLCSSNKEEYHKPCLKTDEGRIEIWGTFSAWTTTMRRPSISWSDNRENRTMAHLLWMGSIILAEVLQARANRVVFEYISIVLLNACCAPVVMLN